MPFDLGSHLLQSAPHGLKRSANRLRSLYRDPPPRMRQLTLCGCAIGADGLSLTYEALGRSFRVPVALPAHIAAGLRTIPDAPRDQALTALGLVLAPFFFRLSDFAQINVASAALDPESAAFFEAFFVGGLAEFRYRQGLDPTRPVRVVSQPAPHRQVTCCIQTRDEALMLNGGGKDTIVAAELLKAGGQPFSWLTVRPNATRRAVVTQSGVAESEEIDFDTRDLERITPAYPWGHFPWASAFLVLGFLVALAKGMRYVVAGNEASADRGNVRYRGMDVNHQYSKSFRFEQGLADFVGRCVTPDVQVFSLLRPFHDLQLGRMFAACRDYFPHFISCNRSIRHGQWCNACPKCAFTALALAPFLSEAELQAIFGSNPLESPPVRSHIVELVSGTIKPWECVGTQDECRLALKLLLDRHPDMAFAEAPRRDELEALVADLDVVGLRHRLLETAQPAHAIPTPMASRLNAGLEALGWPHLAIASREPPVAGPAGAPRAG